jgi:nucleotide-binding universal stress UspA family protein
MNILIPIDGSAGSKAAAKVGLRIAETHSAKIILLHVISATGQKRKKWMDEGAKKLLSVYEDTMAKAGIHAGNITTIIEEGDPAAEIVETAELRGMDRIVIGTHGKTGIKKLTGSVTEKVLRHSRVLVLVVPPKYEMK